MENFTEELEVIASVIVAQNAEAKSDEYKPNYSNRDFFNCLIIFQNALMDKLWDNQEVDKMGLDDRLKMAESCGMELSRLIHTYTGLDTHKLEDFV